MWEGECFLSGFGGGRGVFLLRVREGLFSRGEGLFSFEDGRGSVLYL